MMETVGLVSHNEGERVELASVLEASLESAAPEMTWDERVQIVRQFTADKFAESADWVEFYREVLGVDGIVAELFSTADEKDLLQKTPEYAEILLQLTQLRAKNRGQFESEEEDLRVITVRLPKSLHEALRHEAHRHRTSMNKLCISKLIQVIDGELVPSEFASSETSGRGRRSRKRQKGHCELSAVSEPASTTPPDFAAESSAEPTEFADSPQFTTIPTAGAF